jgi:small-conductance mechanosensitive channel
MGWRSTTLRTLSDTNLVLPNNTLLNAELENWSRPAPRIARNIELPVAYQVSPEQVLAWVREELVRVPGVCPDPPPKAWLRSFEPGFQRYQLKVWIDEFRVHDDVESDCLKALWGRFAREGAPLQHPLPLRLWPSATGVAQVVEQGLGVDPTRGVHHLRVQGQRPGHGLVGEAGDGPQAKGEQGDGNGPAGGSGGA